MVLSKEKRMRIFFIAALWIVLGSSHAVIAQPNPSTRGAHVQFYLENYGRIDPARHPQVARAYAVFERVRRVADRKDKYVPQLYVIDSNGHPWAIALPDGSIILTRKAVDITYQAGSAAEGDARMAFVLGHELAHLAKDDFWHRDVYQALAGRPEGISLRTLLKRHADVRDADLETQLAVAKQKEWQADDWGLLYASLAGYPTHTLLGAPATGQPHFFDDWMQQTQTAVDEAHPTPQERAVSLQTRLQRLQDQLEFFYTGVQLMHFGRYEDARYFLQEFQRTFPAREVLNNLGLSDLQLARKAMGLALAERYCLPTRLDTETRAAGLAFRGGDADPDPPLPPKARDYLHRAMASLQRAVEADPTYLPARLNLATAYFYLGEIYKARAVIEEARQLAPDQEDVANLRALILYRDGLVTDLWPSALKILEEVAARPQASACTVYNLAQVLEERGRANKAQTFWSALATRRDALSPYQQRRVCQRLTDPAACQTIAATDLPDPAPLPWTLPAPIGFDLQGQPDSAQKYFANWQAAPFDWEQRGMQGHLYKSPAGAVALDLDGYVEMITLRDANLGAAADVASHCEVTLARKVVTNGEVWTCANRWAVLIQDHQVREAWIVRR